jgi:hypothetical protein
VLPIKIALATIIRKDDGVRATGVMKTKNVKHEFDVTIHTEKSSGFPFTIDSIVINSSSNNTSAHIKITYSSVSQPVGLEDWLGGM